MAYEKEKDGVLALIGARSGSKGVPHKNVKLLGGKPLIGWIVEAARNAKTVDRVIVSTDSEEYAKVARRFGAETPFLRPKEISGDTASDLEYILHALEWLDTHEGYRPEVVVRLIPTVPFQRPGDIDECINKLLGNPRLDSVMGVSEARQHPGKALKIVGEGHLVPYLTEFTLHTYPHARQEHQKAYFRGNIIATRTWVLTETKTLYGERSGHHIIPREYAIDIDSEIDFLLAEAILSQRYIKEDQPEII